MLYRYVNDFPLPWKIQISLIQIVKFTRIGIDPPPPGKKLSLDTFSLKKKIFWIRACIQ